MCSKCNGLVAWVSSLTKVFDLAEHVLCNGFLIFDDFLNDHGLGEGLVDSLGHYGLSRSVKQLLLAITEGVGLNTSVQLCNALVGLPVVVARALLARCEVSMGALVHLLSFISFFIRALGRVEYVLGIHGGTSWHTESVVLVLGLLGPVVAALVALTEGLANG